MSGTRALRVPSHTLYADDIFIFCKGSVANVRALSELFFNYAQSSGKISNTSKSTIFPGSMHEVRLNHTLLLTCFTKGYLPLVQQNFR